MAEDKVLSVEEALAAEVKAIRGSAVSGPPSIRGQDAQEQRVHLNSDRHAGDLPQEEVARREAFYRWLNGLNHVALCCSGGGIRSATFCLGVIQALAGYDVTEPPPRSTRPADEKAEKESGALASEIRQAETLELQKRAPDDALLQKRKPQEVPKPKVDPKDSLLRRFHYLSTVSGGGYVGSWLSSWRTHDHFDTIIYNLTRRPEGADVEPPEISWLRAYSNYLTPRLGIGSADAWAAVAIIVRNLVLNWLVIIPVLCLAILALKLVATFSVWVAHDVDDPHWMIPLALAGAIFLIIAQAFTTYHRPARLLPPPDLDRPAPPEPPIRCPLCHRDVEHEKCFLCRRVNVDDKCFKFGNLLWAALSAIFVTIFFTSHYFSTLLGDLSAYLAGGGTIPEIAAWLGLTPKVEVPALTAAAGLVVYTIGWIAGWPQVFSRRDWSRWALSGLIYGALVGVGAYLFSVLMSYSCSCVASGKTLPLLLAISFGVPWVLMAQLTADNIFGGFVSYEPLSDSDREWLGRAAGWISAVAIAWAIAALLIFAGGYLLQIAQDWIKQLIVAMGGVSGIAAAFLGSSSRTSATSSSADQTDYVALALNIGLAIAGPIFAAVLIIVLSIALDNVLLGAPLVDILQGGSPQNSQNALPSMPATVSWLIGGSVVLFIIAWIASRCVNINRFSLHALYRNRLVRAYLGASRQWRRPNRFTGFDLHDNIRMHELWPPKAGGKVESNSLFHVINIALNVVSTKRLAWQERKAEPFTASPLHCGSAYLGYRDSRDYGDSIHTRSGQGIALGTAMAISGAAVSSNMGYHSSPSLALLLTLFNVRLGWWLGNPGEPGNKRAAFRREGPRLAAKPLFDEGLGLTTDTSAYVYLSDGGHFENLGLYEMVRRRCRFIVVIDAGCDPNFTFEDLGNAVRKIYIDLGVRIRFEGLEKLRNRPTKDDPPPATIPYHAIGTIDYIDADGKPTDDPGCKNGYVLYIKPAYHGVEGAAIQSYAKANEKFPHQDTADQWFTESQFESYRALGMDIANTALGAASVQDIVRSFV